ncbi:M56 family metallopeptidase [Marilutibacter spongiae]|uniref:Peptidase M56 domain-containing protein n=1 Tax=Marilutibacter spongiae TaxID=2025720 RepID=A0A7W3Y4W5_9GAMM|nr:M56 family metallopeptidase [Lysobacter spongiae]MBB1059582.1 hypothetical protein [Lysobacter spongiae]
MTELATTLVPAIAGTLFAFLWQGAVVGVLAWLALGLLRHARPQARYAVACLALLACVVLPASHLLRALSAPVDGTPPPGTGMADAAGARFFSFQPDSPGALDPAFRPDAWPDLPPDSLPWIVALWAAGAGLLAIRMGLGLRWVHRLHAGSLAAGDDGWQCRLDAMARALGIRRPVAWRVLADGDSPLSVGWWRPVVMVPAALVLRMPTPLLEALVAHELAHVRRHDYLVNLLQGVVEILLFYHPVTWWLSRRIRLEREQVADDLAATLIGEPRRLAVALSELDRYAVPVPNPALAAHGGQLMSRIQQLVRPPRSALRGVVALPLVAMAIAGLAIAHAASTPTPAPVAPAQPAPATPAQAPVVPAAPAGRPSSAAPPAPPARATPPQAAPEAPARSTSSSLTTTHYVTGDRGAEGYALVRSDHDAITLVGDMQTRDAVQRARESIQGDFIWLDREGKSYVVTDPATLAKARAAWAPLDTLDARMQALDARMRPHGERMEALGARMEALSEADHHDQALEAAGRRMQALGERQGAMGARQAAMADRISTGDAQAREQARREMEVLAKEQAELARRMEVEQRAMEAHSARMEARMAPMEALGRQMEDAGKPMEAIGKDMEAVGKQIELAAVRADAQVRRLIDEAFAAGLARPAPARR